MSLELFNLPEEIKGKLRELAADYEYIREDGKGGNGYVVFAKNRILNTDIVFKFYNWGGDPRYHAEPRQLALLSSPNILPINTAGLINNRWAYYVSPNCKNGDLDDFISGEIFSNYQAIDIASQVLSGVSVLHGSRFIHRDLKPANIYIDNVGVALIGDFGSVKSIPTGQSTIPASAHSILYRPPESVSHGQYGMVGDIYQVGVVLYQLLGGYLPYDEQAWLSDRELPKYNAIVDPVERTIFADKCLKEKIVRGRVIDLDTLPCWVPVSMRRIISKSIAIDPSRRQQSAGELLADLHRIRGEIGNWVIEGNLITRIGDVS